MHKHSKTNDQDVLRFFFRIGLRVCFRGLVRPPVPIAVQRVVVRALTCCLPQAQGVRLERARLAGLPCEWHWPAKTAPATAGVILYLHGGGFVLGGANTHRALVSHLAHQTHMAVVAVDYRRSPEHPFPAARDDALRALQALLDSGYPPCQIVIAGDSAGGNLSLITGLRLLEVDLPQPAAYVCFSPVTDLTGTHLQRFPDLWHVFQAQAGVLRAADRALADVVVFLQSRVRASPQAQASSVAN